MKRTQKSINELDEVTLKNIFWNARGGDREYLEPQYAKFELEYFTAFLVFKAFYRNGSFLKMRIFESTLNISLKLQENPREAIIDYPVLGQLRNVEIFINEGLVEV